MKVKAVSQHLGIPISTLHYYERKELVVPKRTAGNYREYGEVYICKINFILLMKESGLSIEEITATLRRFFQETHDEACIHEAKMMFGTHIAQMEQQILRYQQMIELIRMLPLYMEKDNDEIRGQTHQLVERLFAERGMQHE